MGNVGGPHANIFRVCTAQLWEADEPIHFVANAESGAIGTGGDDCAGDVPAKDDWTGLRKKASDSVTGASLPVDGIDTDR
ncbi:MAG: hypothetical protein Q4D83_04040 [Corynebacterium sp.]|nr:hypothetical protein [Corynebacterium sp.]MDO5076437.1 hypothetical protein [Corynebacterium sp.]